MFYLRQKKQINILNRRTFFLFLGKLSLLSFVGLRLYKIQIIDSKKYETLSKNNQIDVQILYPLRGLIKDRYGNILANNLKVFDLYIIPEKTKNINLTLNRLSEIIDMNFEKKREIINLNKKIKKFEKIKIFENLDWKTLELIETNKNYLDGLELIEDSIRIYPEKEYFSHILGYVNKPSKKDLTLPYISKMPLLNIGQQGVEKFFNEELVGKSGNKEVEVNSSGRIVREVSKKLSINGQDLQLSLDSNLQKFTANQLVKHKAGSIVVMDVKSGEILSMTSYPKFDSNLIVKKPNADYWDSLLKNSLSPLTDRSVQGLYAPGSTFKMMVAIAALKHGLIDINSKVFCTGKITYGKQLFHCWKTRGHGSMNIISAIQESCDVFFYDLAMKVGIDRIALVAEDFGLGQVYESKIGNQKKGIVPSKKWKKTNLKKKWYGGETLIAAIGQGYVLATPLQLAVMITRIASSGKKVLPSIIKSTNINEFDLMIKYQDQLKIIKKSLFGVVNEKRGTANKSKSKYFNFSGKTGTSQVKKITLAERESEDFRNIEILWKNRDHALFVGYMPSENPKYSISVVIEHGGSGASTAAPIAKEIFNYINKNIIE
jgi:penicillin-binding protein 2